MGIVGNEEGRWVDIEYLGDVKLESLFHEDGQTGDESVESPVEAKLANVDGMDGTGGEDPLPRDAVVL